MKAAVHLRRDTDVTGGLTGEPSKLPRVAVFWDPAGFSAFELADAAVGVADLVFVSGLVDPRGTERLLRRKGAVVDAVGLDTARLAAELVRLEVVGVAGYTDSVLLDAAHVADRIGCRFHSVPTAEQLVDKYRQRVALAAGGVPTPRFREVPADRHPEQIARAAAEVGFPLVIKPVRGAGSRLVSLVHSPGELHRELQEYGEEPAVLEAYLESVSGADDPFSDVVSVETIVQDGKCLHLTTTGRFAFDPPFREAGMFMPGALDPATNAAVQAAAGEALHAVGIEHGICHTEVKVTPEGPRIIEVNGRIGGEVPSMLTVCGGPPLLRLSLRLALGERIEARPLEATRVGYYLRCFPPVEAMTLLRLEGIDRLHEIPGVAEVRQSLAVGAAIDFRLGSGSQLFDLSGAVDSHEELLRVRQRIAEAVDIGFEFAGTSGGDSAELDVRPA